MMKKTVIMMMFCWISITAIGQEKVEQLKIAYFTKELNLTSGEAEKFWPIYNEMEGKIKEIRKNRRKTAKNLYQNADSLSNDAVKKSTLAIFDSEIAEINVKKEYYNKMGDAIGYKKASKVYKLELEFRKKLLDRLKDQRGAGGGPGGNRPPRPGGPNGQGRPGGPMSPKQN
jgi:hypothetical protein